MTNGGESKCVQQLAGVVVVRSNLNRLGAPNDLSPCVLLNNQLIQFSVNNRIYCGPLLAPLAIHQK